MVLRQQVEGPAQAAQHAQPEHIDLHELERVDVVLVPLDDLAVLHGGRLDWHQVDERVAGQHETAGVLTDMAGEADELLRQVEGEAQAAVAGVEVQRLGVPLLDALLRPAPHLGGECAGDVLGQAEHLADLAHGAAGAVADDRGAERGAAAAVMLVHPLDDLLAALVLEIDVDVGRLVALGGDEALEQQPGAGWIDAGDAEHVADGGVGGRAAALAEDALAPGVADDAVHRQKIGRVFQLPDQRQFVRELGGDVAGDGLFGIAVPGALPGQPLQRLLR